MTDHDDTETETETDTADDQQETIDAIIDRYDGRLSRLLADLIADATDHLRIQLARETARADRLEHERDELQARTDYLRDRLLNRHAQTQPDPAGDHGSERDTGNGGVALGDPSDDILAVLDTTDHDCQLADALQNGPGAVEPHVYPVHERAHTVLTHLIDWGDLVTHGDDDEWTVKVTARSVRDGIAATRDEDLTSTQTRRVFETITKWGQDCPTPPTLTKDPNDELQLYIADGLVISTLLASPDPPQTPDGTDTAGGTTTNSTATTTGNTR